MNARLQTNASGDQQGNSSLTMHASDWLANHRFQLLFQFFKEIIARPTQNFKNRSFFKVLNLKIWLKKVKS